MRGGNFLKYRHYPASICVVQLPRTLLITAYRRAFDAGTACQLCLAPSALHTSVPTLMWGHVTDCRLFTAYASSASTPSARRRVSSVSAARPRMVAAISSLADALACEISANSSRAFSTRPKVCC